MSGLDLEQLRRYVVAPALQSVLLWSKSAENLVLATGLAESRYRYLDQIERGGDKRPGPARGLWQMEAATYRDIWDNFLKHNQPLAARIRPFIMDATEPLEQLHGNLYFAAIMCRVHYFRVPEALPRFDDIEGHARYWKRYYNTIHGAGTVDGFIQTVYPVFR